MKSHFGINSVLVVKGRGRPWLLLLLMITALPIRSGSLSTPQDLESSDLLEPIYFENATLLGTETRVPRPPQQIANGLKSAVKDHPDRPEYLKYLAEQEVLLLQFREAEQHMLDYVKAAGPTAEAYKELASFYASRHMPAQQISALESAAHASVRTPNRGRFIELHPAYVAYMEILAVVDEQRPAGSDRLRYLRDLAALFPQEQSIARKLHEQLRAEKRTRELRAELEGFRTKYPQDTEYALTLEAEVLALEGQIPRAIQLLGSRFQPLWSSDAIGGYYGLLRQDRKRWTEYTSGLAARLERNPVDLDAAIRLFYCYQQDGNVERAIRVLHDYRRYKERLEAARGTVSPTPWQATELYVLGHLFKQLSDFNESARHFYALYELLSQPAYRESTVAWEALRGKVTREEALHQIFALLLMSVGRPTQLGAGNLQYYRRISELDQHPGLLNGVLAILLNRTYPLSRFGEEESKATTYFNARKAEELFRVFAGQYPRSTHLPSMALAVLQTYSSYGQHELVIRLGTNSMTQFRDKEEALSMGLLLADSYTALGRREDMWKTYDQLLSLLGQRAIGDLIAAPAAKSAPQSQSRVNTTPEAAPPVEAFAERPLSTVTTSSGITYDFVLQRYISSLTTAGETMRALALYRREIDAHPKEAVLYDRLATFLEQHRIFDEVERLYQRAIQQFKDRSWYDRLARWYLRLQMHAEYAKLSQRVVEVFRGSEIDEYIQTIVKIGPAANRVFLQVNLFAHQRFPHHLSFAHNLLDYYRHPRTRNLVEWEKLARQYFFSSPQVQQEYLAYLSAQNQLRPTLDALMAGPSKEPTALLSRLNPAEVRFLADGLVWRSQFEQAAPLLSSLASTHPDIRTLVDRDADLKRSLGAFDRSSYIESARTRERLALIYPLDASLLVKAGETYADAQRIETAAELWKRIPSLKPGSADPYLEAATVFWDYFRFDDALEQIQRHRAASKDTRAMCYEAGAIYESRGDLDRAIGEYLLEFNPQEQPNYQARNRLSQLLERADARQKILQQALDRVRGPLGIEFLPSFLNFLSDARWTDAIRMAVEARLSDTAREPLLGAVRRVLHARSMMDLEERLLITRESIASDSLEKLQAAVDLADFYAVNRKIDEASQTWNRLLAAYPKNAGVIGGSVRHFWRFGPQQRALAILTGSLANSNKHYARQFLLDIARYQTELNDLASAETALKRLLEIDPLNVDYINQLSRLYARRNAPDQLARHYQEGLLLLERDSTLTTEEKNARISQFRLGLVEAYTSLNKFTDAIDQYIEVIKRQPENAELVGKASAFAEEHNVAQRFLDYFSRQAAQSAKDFRWPWVLARAQQRLGNLADSQAYYRKTLDVQPDRTDILKELVDVLLRLHQDDEAVAALRKLYQQTYRDSRWLYLAADIRARQGRSREASDLLDEALAADSIPSAQRWLHRAARLESWNNPPEAYAAGDRGLQLFEQNQENVKLFKPGLDAYVEASVRLAKAGESCNRLLSLLRSTEDGYNRYVLQSTLQQTLPRTLRQFATASQIEAADVAIRGSFGPGNLLPPEQWKNLVLPPGRGDDRPYLQEWVLKKILDHSYEKIVDLNDNAWMSYRQHFFELQRFYKERQAFAELAAWQEAEWRRNRYRMWHAEDLVEVAGYYRTLGRPEDEIRILREYMDAPMRGDGMNLTAVSRYVALLASTKKDAELEDLASNPGPDAIAVANSLIEAGKPALASRAIAAVPDQTPRWVNTQRAMIGLTSVHPGPEIGDLFRSVLRLENIGQMIAQPPDPDQRLVGKDWFYYASRYGEYQARSGAGDGKGSDVYLLADLEGYARDAAAQMRVGDTYLGLSKPVQALQFFKQAVGLQPLSYRFRGRLAAASMAAGDRAEAIAQWKEILEKQKSPDRPSARRLDTRIRHAESVMDAAVQHNFFEEIQGSLREFAQEAVSVQGSYGSERILEALLSRSAGADRNGLLRNWVSSAPAPQAMADYLLDMDILTTAEKEPIFLAVADYLSSRIEEGDEWQRNYIRRSGWFFQMEFARYFIEAGRLDGAEEILKQFTPPDEGPNELSRWHQLRAALELKRRNPGEALRSLMTLEDKIGRFANPSYFAKSVSLLRRSGYSQEAASLEEYHYRRWLENDARDPSYYLGLAEALYEQNKRSEAQKTLNRMLACAELPGWDHQSHLYFNPDGPEARPTLETQAAELAERFNDLAWAFSIRQTLERSVPPFPESVEENRLSLARLRIKNGNVSAGLESVRMLLSDDEASMQQRRSAALLVAELVDKSPSETLKSWIGTPQTVSAIRDDELKQFMGALAFRASGDSAAEMNAHARSLQQIRYGQLAAVRLFASRDRAAASDATKAMQRLLYLDPENRTRRPEMFYWLFKNGLPRMALSAVGPRDEFERGYYPVGRSLATQSTEDEESRLHHPLSVFGLEDKANYELAMAISKAAEEGDLFERAELFARWAVFLSKKEADRSAAAQRFRELGQRRKASESQRNQLYRVRPNLGPAEETNP